MGADSTDKRSSDTLAMLDYGFNMYKINNVVSKDKSLGRVKVELGKDEYVDIISINDINILNNSQSNDRNISYDIKIDNIIAPIKKGDIVGKITVYEDGKYLLSEDITIVNDIDKANIFLVFVRNLKDIFGVNV